ncbi:MAG: ABC-2 family transporter protein [Capsulimonadaceae bacterium]|nr:ABC-2 family transporter protein [Capsulimonadaceae bacterium]
MTSLTLPNPLIEARKWLRVYGVFFADALAYKANAFIWLMTDAVPAFIMPLIWLSSYNGRTHIHGYSPSQMVIYYIAVLFLSSVIDSHIMWDMANDVKQGKFNIYLVRPYSYMLFCGAANLSWRLVRNLLFIPLFFIILAAFRPWVHFNAAEYDFGWHFWLAIVLGHLLSFSISYALGLVALWVIETQSLYHFYYLPLIILNGQIAPLSFFPKGLREVAIFLPFNYTLGFPAQIFVKSISEHGIYFGFAMQLAWTAIAFACAIGLWRGGLKRYTAYGI